MKRTLSTLFTLSKRALSASASKGALLVLFITLAQAQTPVTIIASDSLVRPANATAYAANDVVNDSATAANDILIFKTPTFNSAGTVTGTTGVVVNKGMGGLIVSALVTTDTANTTNGTFRLLLFSDTVTVAADNAAWASSQTSNARSIGHIDFALESNGGSYPQAYVTGLSLPFQCAPDDTKLYGVLLAKAAYTPKHNGKIIVKLGIIR
jgi:hypothetical protein